VNKIVKCRQPIPPLPPHLFVLVILRVLANVAPWIPHGCRTAWSAYTIHTIQDCVIPTSRSLVAALLLRAPSASSIAAVPWVFCGGKYRRDIRKELNIYVTFSSKSVQNALDTSLIYHHIYIHIYLYIYIYTSCVIKSIKRALYTCLICHRIHQKSPSKN